MLIRPFAPEDLSAAAALWNQCCASGDVLYCPLEEDAFLRRFTLGEGCLPDHFLAAEENGSLVGFLHAVAPETFRGARKGVGYVTCLMVRPDMRSRGIGRALLEEEIRRLKACGADSVQISSVNPVNLSWRIPGTPGHDHNNMPGLDTECAGAGFFRHMGFDAVHTEVAMYLNLKDYHQPPEIPQLREKLRAQGIETGPWSPDLGREFDGMCDRVGSDYWRDVLRTETGAWLSGAPNADTRFWPDGRQPSGPRTLLTATTEGHIVGFTGPVDRQMSGRGWFTGICTDPLYERRGIATVLFHLLMQAFVENGSQFSTLFTGTDNHAQRIYLGAGMRPVRKFDLMKRNLEEAQQ
ncbi:MAG: GNAT family N-acetyltransferase [Clostridia bacterium]|nr:GNAT family N-acetyltransferase [Clostridia bacterium]